MQKIDFSRVRLIFILGMLSMLMPLAIDMYLPSLPTIAQQFNVDNGRVQLTLSLYIAGFAIGQIFYGPLADCIGRKAVIISGTLAFAITGILCALAKNIEQLTYMRFIQGLSAAAASVVINALMRDLFKDDEFARMMSFVTLVMIIAPLIAPMIGGLVLYLFDWHAIFWIIAIASLLSTLLVACYIQETLPKQKRQKFHIRAIYQNFITLIRQKYALCYMLSSAFAFAGMFSFLSAGSFVYIQLNHVSPQHFGYYFALNVVFLFVMTLLNGKYVQRYGAVKMMKFGLCFQFITGVLLVVTGLLHLSFGVLVFAVAAFVGGVSMIAANAMSVVLKDFPHMAGTASSLVGTLRFGTGALVGIVLSMTNMTTSWPMIGSMFLCTTIALLLFFLAQKLAYK